ncbi:unnamed protein product [Calicophoron daubneyi]|uniref:Uncharacterized protein n=1 Tax=Calicophoron daubneyi TaxID=300641 RepID=A0AAV2THV2_CALDB
MMRLAFTHLKHIQIVFQTIISFAIACFGLVGIAGNLKEIEAAAEFRDKCWDSLKNRTAFYTFRNRNFTLSAHRLNSFR